jgi:hypothetical protein
VRRMSVVIVRRPRGCIVAQPGQPLAWRRQTEREGTLHFIGNLTRYRLDSRTSYPLLLRCRRPFQILRGFSKDESSMSWPGSFDVSFGGWIVGSKMFRELNHKSRPFHPCLAINWYLTIALNPGHLTALSGSELVVVSLRNLKKLFC